MELVKDEKILKMIKDDKIDAIFFEKIDAILDIESRLDILGRKYIASLYGLDSLDNEILSKLSALFEKDFEDLDAFKGYILKLGEKLEYEELEDRVDDARIVYDSDGRAYRFVSIYTDRTREGSSTEVYNMSYSLYDGEELDTKSEANMYIASSCKCCTKREANIIFPEGEDVNHYIIVSKLNEIENSLSKYLEKYKEVYDFYIEMI